MGVIVCDSSSLISLSETCNLDCLAFLAQKTSARFFITNAVEKEIVFNPLNYTQHAFSALRLKNLVAKGTLKVTPTSCQAEYDKLNQLSNNLFTVNGNALRIMQAGELECLAAYRKIGANGMLTDEKTARLLVESPTKLLESLKQEYRGQVALNEVVAKELEAMLNGIKIIRSSEVLALAYEKGFFSQYPEIEEEAFHAAEYAARYAGCSISARELAEYERMK